MSGDLNKSRPLYPGLKPDANAAWHLIAAEGDGATAVEALLMAAPHLLSRATILYVARGEQDKGFTERLQKLGAEACRVFPTIATMLFLLDSLLSRASMGVRLYAAGTEGFIGQVGQCALAHGIDSHEIVSEHRGSLARRVQCIHCKGITENVTATIAACGHCGIPLQVRDHYSRRLGAFMGVSADAETPGTLPGAPEPFR